MADFVASKTREGLEVFHSFLDTNMDKIEKDEPVMLLVLDLDSITDKVVKGIVAREAKDDGEWADLWIKDRTDKIVPEPWKIKVLEEFDEDEVDLKRPDADETVKGGMYGTVMTTTHMKQEAEKFKKEFGKKK
jgi:hypothetical protein